MNDENEVTCFTVEVIEGWTHLRMPVSIDAQNYNIQNSLLIANDRLLGFRFCVDENGETWAAQDILTNFTSAEGVLRVFESMMESVPSYEVVFGEIQDTKSVVTEKQLDEIADAINGKAN